MSDRIAALIDEVKRKSLAHRDVAAKEKNRAAQLDQELAKLKLELSNTTAEVERLKDEVKRMEDDKNQQEIGGTGRVGSRVISENEIDDLVKEIDYCIEQLKK